MEINVIQNKMPTPIIISIDGNIGAGKTTFLNELKATHPEWHFIDEPVDSWLKFKNEQGESLLEVFYKDRKRWSYTFQNCAFLTRVRAITKAIDDWKEECILNPEKAKHNIFITERCVETDYNVFAKMLHDDGSLDKMEWDMYRQWYRFLTRGSAVSAVIYITCSPEKCKQRIGIRQRDGEDSIPLGYLSELHKYHEEWINNTTIPVHSVSTEEDGKENYLLEEVNKFVTKI
jgi:deoxyadenosine/deoxycytidine kinase